MTDDSPQPPSPPAVPQKPINNSWRWFAGILGIGAMSAGTTAVFTTEVEAGPVALLLVGAVFALVAMSGRLPSRLKVGENEAAWEAVQEYVRETIDEAPPEDKPQEVVRATELARVVPQLRPSAVAVEGAAFEVFALDALRRAVDRVPELRLIDRVDTLHHDLGFDAGVETIDGSRRVLVIIKLEVNPTIKFRQTIQHQLTNLRDTDQILILTLRVIDEIWLALDKKKVRIFELHNSSDVPRLRGQLQAMLLKDAGIESD